MGKLNNKKAFIIFGAAAVCISLAYRLSLLAQGKTVQAFVTPMDAEVGQAISFGDSTSRAHSWLWEFGNGETSEARTGNYSYSKEGKYQIRLTVDGQFEEKFLVNVRPKVDKDPYGELIKIDAPGFALQNEIISVRGLGNAKEWRWEFGETGMIDSREKNTLYSYSEAGTYEILLSTETTQYPVRHTIRIEPNFQRNDSADVQTLIGNDIRERLQAIVDGKPFNQNYNYILSSYLCNNPDVVVTVNGEKHNDFYSYCQGLKIIGRKRLVIENVVVDVKDDESDECVKQLLVTQYDKPLTK